MKEGGKMNKAEVKKELKAMFDDYIEREKPEQAVAVAKASLRLGLISEKDYDKATTIALKTYERIHWTVDGWRN